jgi:hypothetical protein
LRLVVRWAWARHRPPLKRSLAIACPGTRSTAAFRPVLAVRGQASSASRQAATGSYALPEDRRNQRRRYRSSTKAGVSRPYGDTLGVRPIRWSAWPSLARSFGLQCGSAVGNVGHSLATRHSPPFAQRGAVDLACALRGRIGQDLAAVGAFLGGANRDRTGDLLLAKPPRTC